MTSTFNTQSLQFAIMDVFTQNPDKELSVQEIYFFIQDYYKLSDYQKEDDPKYPQPRFHHEIRSILNNLKKGGFVIHRGRNRWVHIPEE